MEKDAFLFFSTDQFFLTCAKHMKNNFPIFLHFYFLTKFIGPEIFFELDSETLASTPREPVGLIFNPKVFGVWGR